MKITVLGLGNAVLTDDSVGLRVAELVESRLSERPATPGVSVSVVCNEAGGWEILDDVAGSDVLILVDAIQDDSLAPAASSW